MGIHVADVIVEDGDIFGDGVNIAARLEGLADPGAIFVSARVHEDAVGRLDLQFEDLGERYLKNIDRPRAGVLRTCWLWSDHSTATDSCTDPQFVELFVETPAHHYSD
jgi:hypothetical protein